jgi:anti-sigma factor RsiW
MTDMDCREARRALGVYVVGAIDPAERALVDTHLSGCPACREELAGLAGLPALLGRVPGADAELLALDDERLRALDEPSPELLHSLLRQVDARRKARRWRAVVAAAAAVVIGLGTGAAITELVGGRAAAHPATETASASNSVTGVTAVVEYPATGRATSMRVTVSGIPWGTTCEFWVVNGTGQRSLAGTWTLRQGYGSGHVFPASSELPASSVHGFVITTTSGKKLLTIPAS